MRAKHSSGVARTTGLIRWASLLQHAFGRRQFTALSRCGASPSRVYRRRFPIEWLVTEPAHIATNARPVCVSLNCFLGTVIWRGIAKNLNRRDRCHRRRGALRDGLTALASACWRVAVAAAQVVYGLPPGLCQRRGDAALTYLNSEQRELIGLDEPAVSWTVRNLPEMTSTKSRSQPATQTHVEDWRTADREAHKLERAFLQASLQALEGRGPVPSEEQRQAVRALRRAADDLFQRLMDEFAARARANGTDSGSQRSLW